MERYGTITAAPHAQLCRIEHILLVPEVVIHVSWHEMVLGKEGEEPAAAQRVSGVSGGNAEILHALAHLNVLRPAGVLAAHKPVFICYTYNIYITDFIKKFTYGLSLLFTKSF